MRGSTRTPATMPFRAGRASTTRPAAQRRFGGSSTRLRSTVLVVCHEIPIRYALNGAAGSDSLDGPTHEISNAVPYLFDEEALTRAASGIERLAKIAGRDREPLPSG